MPIDGFGGVVIHAWSEAKLAISRHGSGDHGDDLRELQILFGFQLTNPLGGLLAVHFGHVAFLRGQGAATEAK